jgi:hypothetical protein
MKKILITVLISLNLMGCATTFHKIEPSIIVQYKYVSLPIPPEYLNIPTKIEDIDLNKATQRNVADWLARSEGRTKDLESKINYIKKFQMEQQNLQTDVK